MAKIFDELRLAIAFLTLLPVSPKKELDASFVANSVSYFSLAGFLFSALNILNIYAFGLYKNTFVFALLLIISHSLLSGALHLDAVMDSHDGLAVSDRPRVKILEVMKDSRVGAFAVISIVIILLAQFVFVSQMNFNDFAYLYILVFVPVFSRFFMVLELVFFVKEEKLEEKSSLRSFVSFNKTKVFLFNLLFVLLVIFIYPMAKICIVAFFGVALLSSILIYRFLYYKLKGHNGDSIGCGLVLNETLMYFLVFIFSKLF